MKNRKTLGQGWLIALAMLAGIIHLTAQTTEFTYQGRVTDNGANFTGTGQFEFSLVYNTNVNSQASATVTTVTFSGVIQAITVNYGGNGYVTAPAVTINSASGSGATATATVSGGVVTGINVVNGGTEYPVPGYPTANPTTVTIAPPPTSDYTNITLWNNDGSSSAEPAAAVSLGVTNGLFTVVLGDTTRSNMTAIPAGIFSQFTYPYPSLQIWFNDGVHGFAALSPVQPLTPVPSATFANTASNLLGTVPTSQLTGSLSAANLTGSIPAGTLTSVPAGSLTGAVFPAALGTTNSYTPTIGDGTHNFTATTQSGYYAEVGSLVYFTIWLEWTSKGSAVAADNLTISLPVPTVSPRETFTLGFLNGFTFNNELTAGSAAGDAYFILYNLSNSGGDATVLPVSSCGNSGEIQVSGVYRWQ